MFTSTSRPLAQVLAAAAVWLLLACSALAQPQENSSGTAAVRAGTSILPHKYFIERIGGDRVRAEVLVLPGQNPHSYEPRPKQIAELTGCSVYFTIGMPFEDQLLPRLREKAKDMQVVNLQEGIKLREFSKDEIEAHERSHAGEDGHAHGHHDHDHAHDHGHGHDHHAHEAKDPHTWLDPKLAKKQAKTIHDALVKADPAGKEKYNAGYNSLAGELEALDRELAESLAPLKGKPLLVYHPAFGYFADAYGLRQVAVETGGKEPSARQLAALVKLAKAQGVKVVFVQPQFSQESARALADQIGGAVVPLDDLAEDYLGNLRQIAQKVRENVK